MGGYHNCPRKLEDFINSVDNISYVAYVEKIKNPSGNINYYLTKTVRLGEDRFKKIRVPFAKRPTKKEIEAALEEIDKKYRSVAVEDFLSTKEIGAFEEIKDAYDSFIKSIPTTVRENAEQDFYIRFTYNTNAIEGNRLTLNQTKMILSDKRIPTGVEAQEYNEVINGKDAFDLIKGYNGKLTIDFLEKINYEITKNTNVQFQGRIRVFPVFITNTEHKPPEAERVRPMLLEGFRIANKKSHHILVRAFMLHGLVAHVHPFEDGNGRTARVLMNWFLIKHNYPKFYIPVDKRDKYYDALGFYDRGDYGEYCKAMFSLIMGQYKKA
ncbi:hypothetical protein COV93_00940 [Candidatus Woesearchaeota archaeon CG11_big_fil_rev_8_21_14_0_20_43_8]|nr:MAG: hypothetical protein COV93_00940 [Candidatus Woesearchaeota archaeon CG11_big_fil_rev_8_21_14_0_20_43_8]PIO05030.1 MAG: hypothetical protein COT47_06510 [Candidatus Woesearchaeota archaeon CG08_land_8_20_14_0_20_43_7]